MDLKIDLYEKKQAVERELEKRELPELLVWENQKITDLTVWEKRREEIKDILCHELYGYMPFRECTTEGEVVFTQENAFGGKAIAETVLIKVTTQKGFCSYPISLTRPKNVEKPPVFLKFNFSCTDEMTEELIDNGYAVASVFYQEIAPDRPESTEEGIAAVIESVPYIGWGKIAQWAYGASRITDYLMTRKELDTGRIALVGHSRLGKAALLCGALDHRYSLIVSAGSGAGGAALFRGKKGEQIENLSKSWFCQNKQKYAGCPQKLPFDQHFLIALAAPQKVYISSAAEDDWADPVSEFLGAAAASPVYELYGKKGLVYDSFPEIEKLYQEGEMAYHLRKGTHCMNRQDWHYYMQYREKHQI